MTFFSGTDTSTLRQEGNDKDNFFSLIVNNEGKYTAGITVKMNDEIKESKNTYSFTDFDGSTVIWKEEDYNYKNWLVHWSEGIVEREPDTHEVDFSDRINEIKASKAQNLAPTRTYTFNNANYNKGSYDRPDREYGPLFDRKQDLVDFDIYEGPGYDSDYEDKFIQLITLSVFQNHKSKMNLRTFVRMLPNMVAHRFGNTSVYYNALESYTEMIFSDLTYAESQECCKYILKKLKDFTSNSIVIVLKTWLEYYLDVLSDADEEDLYHWK